MAGISAYAPNDNDVISLDYFGGEKEDAAEWIADSQNADGSFGANIFQSSLALMGLASADDGNSLLTNAKSRGAGYFMGVQEGNGSFGSDLYTAVSTIALLAEGKSLGDFSVSGKTAKDILAEHQLGNGGFKSGTNDADVDTTSWVMIALSQAGAGMPSKDGNSPSDYLLSAQHSNGSFGYNAADATESMDFTEEAIIALSSAAYPKDSSVQKALGWLASKQDGSGCISDGFRTALGSIAFRGYGEDEKAGKALDCLKILKNGDGSFGRSTNKSNAGDTGIALIALNGLTFPLPSESLHDGNSLADGNVGFSSIVKFTAKVTNRSGINAKNVNIELTGIPPEWVYGSSSGSVNHFDEIRAGQAKTAEIYVKMGGTGEYKVRAKVTAEQAKNPASSNEVLIKVSEALLDVLLSIMGQ